MSYVMPSRIFFFLTVNMSSNDSAYSSKNSYHLLSQSTSFVREYYSDLIQVNPILNAILLILQEF